tara:strand:- start:2672 stop:6631 length:3960 start_codon:yes stop_codon:yes gene_type:complete
MLKLNTLHDGAFTQTDSLADAYQKIKEQGDVHVHHYPKGEAPDDKKKKEKEAKEAEKNGNGNGNGGTASAPPQEEGPPPPEDSGNQMPKFSKDEVKRIRLILKKTKEKKEVEQKLSNKKDKVNTKPKLKDAKIDEMAIELEEGPIQTKLAKSKKGKITVKDHDTLEDAKKHLADMRTKRWNGIILQDGKPIKERVERIDDLGIDEAWEAGTVYHQDYGGGERTYFRADALQKNKRWKGMSVDEIGGKQKKPKNNTADETVRGWEITSNNEIPKGLKEEVEIDEGKLGTVKLNTGDVVSAKMGKGYSFKGDENMQAYKFTNRTQAQKHAEKVGGEVIKPGRVFYVRMNEEVEIDEGIRDFKMGDKVKFVNDDSEFWGETGEITTLSGDGIKQKATVKLNKSGKSVTNILVKVDLIKEKFEIEERAKNKYQLYHKTFSSAMQHAYDVAKQRGSTVDPNEIDNKVATGPKKPSSGKTNRYILGTDTKQKLHVQVANLDNKQYELNMYIEEVKPEENIKMEDVILDGPAINTFNDGAFTNNDPLKDVYANMVANYNEVDPYSGKEINAEEKEEQLNELAIPTPTASVIKSVGKQLRDYAHTTPSIDKDDFLATADVLLKGKLPSEKQIPQDTDPREFVHDLMAKTFGWKFVEQKYGITFQYKRNYKEEVELTEKVKLECQECGKKFSKAKPTSSTRCPKCGGTDIDLAEARENPNDIYEADKQYRRYEGENEHGKAAVYAWKKYHDKSNPREVSHGKDLESINKRHAERGHLSHEDGQKRYKISKTYTDRMHAKHNQTEEVDIEESDKQYRRYEGENQHGKAAVYAWKKYHDKSNPREVSHGKELHAINKRHDERGHLSHEDGQKRYKISKNYTDRMHAKHNQKENVEWVNELTSKFLMRASKVAGKKADDASVNKNFIDVGGKEARKRTDQSIKFHRVALDRRVKDKQKKEDIEFNEDAKMGRQSDAQLKTLHKKFSSMDLSSPANKHFHKRVEKEMEKRGSSPGNTSEDFVDKFTTKIDKLKQRHIDEAKTHQLIEDIISQVKQSGLPNVRVKREDGRLEYVYVELEGKTLEVFPRGNGQIVSDKKLTVTDEMLEGEGEWHKKARRYDVEMKTRSGAYRYNFRSLDTLISLMKEENIIVDGQSGAGEQGTDELVKKYKKDTPGEPNEIIKEGAVTIDSSDDFRKFEHMVEYLMGVSVKYPENFQIFQIEDTPNYRIEHEHGPIATITETDVRNFMGPNVDMEMFIDLARGWGLNITTPEQTHVIGDQGPDDQIVKKIGDVYNESVKNQTPQEYADEYSKRYGLNGAMEQMRKNIEAVAKRI